MAYKVNDATSTAKIYLVTAGLTAIHEWHRKGHDRGVTNGGRPMAEAMRDPSLHIPPKSHMHQKQQALHLSTGSRLPRTGSTVVSGSMCIYYPGAAGLAYNQMSGLSTPDGETLPVPIASVVEGQSIDIFRSPGHLAALPGHLAALLRHLAVLPGNLAALPGHLAALPGHLAALPGHLAALPRHLAALPRHLAALPRHLAALPGHLAALPGHLAALPGRLAALIWVAPRLGLAVA
ncbi:hypothetical protein HOY80DRAFT_1140571 [Tuber brumale]|nr:hypothetical protein HOY80DRAFT_1140571 [Tuber brumale]